jgi:hypothetical protein
MLTIIHECHTIIHKCHNGIHDCHTGQHAIRGSQNKSIYDIPASRSFAQQINAAGISYMLLFSEARKNSLRLGLED